jgi:hypothetical protein
MNNEGQPQVVPDLIWRVLKDETVVVSPVDGKYCVLNGIGSIIWQLLTEERSLGQIEQHLVDYYDVSAEQAQMDIGRFLSDLSQRGLVRWGA